MIATYPEELNALYKQNTDEYMSKKATINDKDDEMGKKLASLQGLPDDTDTRRSQVKRSSDMPFEDLEASINHIIAVYDGMKDGFEWEVKYIFKEYDMTYAWDDMNNMELPIEMVEEARAEEMMHMKGKIFGVVKLSWRRAHH